MTRSTHRRTPVVVALAALSFAGTVNVVAATAPPSPDPTGTETGGPTGPLCAAVPADGEGSVSGMADDPVATAASNNPLLSTLSAAIRAAGLSDTLNGGGLFTVFAPINSAFDKIDRATLQGVAADTDALAEILTYHVLAEQMSSADLVAGGTFATVNGAELTVAMVGETLVINGGAAAVQCAEVPTANATVYLIDTLLMTPTTTEAASTTTVPAEIGRASCRERV